MKTFKTENGDVEILNARILRASGYGQYKIEVDIAFDGQRGKLTIHSTDSILFDAATDDDADHFDVVMEDAQYIIEGAIEDYVYSL